MRRSLVVIALCLFAVSIHAGILAQFRTLYGDIEVELFDKDKPITVTNFIRYVQSGKYQNLILHRLEPAFVLQGGGWTVFDRGTTNFSLHQVEAFETIKNEYGAGNIYSNTYGTIAMARLGGDTNSASSEWYFNLTNSPHLDQRTINGYYTVFGRVVRGTNVLNIFNTFEYYNGFNNSNVVAYITDFLNEIPMRKPIWWDTNLFFVDISLLNVQIKRTGTAREISWNSMTGTVNRVEFTTNLPPVWYSLMQTNPTTPTATVQDTSSGASRRFYRVRVEY